MDDSFKYKVYFELALDKKPFGKIVFGLSAQTPETSENFRALCTGEKGKGKTGKKLHYLGSIFHRIIPGFMAQGGDFVRKNGTGGESIYGLKFEDENFDLKHNKPGILTMANSGRDTNNSQFYITFVSCPWLDGKHVVFGEILEGIELLKVLESHGSETGKPKAEIMVTGCGEIKEEKIEEE